MTVFKGMGQTALAVVVGSVLPLATGCHSTHNNAGSESSRTSSAYYEPSGGGEAVAANRPGAGVGAQTGMGAAADVPEATQKGAGASNLSPKPEANPPEAAGQAAGIATGGTVTDATALTTSADPVSLAGRPVQLANLEVQQVLGNQLLAVGDPQGRQFFVREPSAQPQVKAGDTVSVTGTVRQVPAEPSSLGLGSQASQALQGMPVYVEAQQMQVTSQ